MREERVILKIDRYGKCRRRCCRLRRPIRKKITRRARHVAHHQLEKLTENFS